MAHTHGELHVAPDGNDAWSGTFPAPNAERTDGPFATLERARDEIRRWKAEGPLPEGGVTVWVHGGTYILERTFELTEEDSGAEDAPIVYRAAEEEEVHLIGGREVRGFKPHRGEILRCDVRALGLERLAYDHPDPVRGFELFFNGRRMELARWPNRDPDDPRGGRWAYIRAVPEEKSRTRFICAGDHPLRWAKPEEAQVHIWPHYNWNDQFVGVAAVDPETREIALAAPTIYELQPGRRFSVRGVFEELDAPGEWYFDRERGVLYFWPPEPIERGRVFVSVLDALVALKGCARVMLRGFVLEYARGAAVVVEGGEGNAVAACTIRNVGGTGVVVRGGRNNGALGCDIYETGRGGVILEGGDRKTLTPAGNYVRNCHIHHYSRLVRCYQAGVIIRGVGNRIAHCLIHDAPHNAILLSGNDHLIEYNEMHHVVQEASDASAFYMGRDWTERGNVVRYNYFHDITGYGLDEEDREAGVYRYASPHGAWAVYLDDCASGTTVFGNLFVRCVMGALHLGGGKDNRFENNIIVECYPPAHVDARWDDFFNEHPEGGRKTGILILKERLEAVDYREPPYCERYPELLGVLDEPRRPSGNVIARNVVQYARDDVQGFWAMRIAPEKSILWHLQNFDAEGTSVDGNIVWHEGHPVRIEQNPYLSKPGGVVSWDEWRRMGFDVHSQIAEPRFADPARDDYRLRRDSPAYALGFLPIPIERIGLYRDEFRASWPVPKDTRKVKVEKVVETIRVGE